MSYYENRAAIRDNETDVEIEVRGGYEADDVPGGYEIRIRDVMTDELRTMRVPRHVWQQFARAVGRLK